jgi:Tol biopolymer transport system component
MRRHLIILLAALVFAPCLLFLLGLGLLSWSNRERTPALEPIKEGKWYLFSCGNDIASTELYRQNLDTGQIDRLTINHEGGVIHASFSPDGERIAYVRYGLPSAQVHTMRTDGEDRHRLVYLPGDTYSPTWSPDGQWIAFVYRPRPRITFREGIYRSSLDGSQVEALVTWDRVDNPMWSPDGEKLAFTSREQGEDQLYVLDLAQRSFEYIAPGSYGFWSPDSSKLFIYFAYNAGDTYIDAHRIVDIRTKEQIFISRHNQIKDQVLADLRYVRWRDGVFWREVPLLEQWQVSRQSYRQGLSEQLGCMVPPNLYK